MSFDNFKDIDFKSIDKNISNSFFKIIHEMDLNDENNIKKAYEILSYFLKNNAIDILFKNYYYNKKESKVPIFFIDMPSKNKQIAEGLKINIISHILEPKFNEIINVIFYTPITTPFYYFQIFDYIINNKLFDYKSKFKNNNENKNILISNLIPTYSLEENKIKIISNVQKAFFRSYEKDYFDSLDENSIFLILKYRCLLNFNIGLKNILNKIKNKINENILKKLTLEDISNINDLIKGEEDDYNFFYLIEINKTVLLDNNLFLEYPLLLLDIELNKLNYIQKNSNNIIIPLNFDYSEKMNVKFTPLDLLKLLYYGKYRESIPIFIFSKLIKKYKKKIDSNIIPTEIMQWFLDKKINTDILLKNNYKWEEKNFFNEIFKPLNFKCELEEMIERHFQLMNYSGLKTLCIEYNDKHKIIEFLNNFINDRKHNIFGRMEKFHILQCLMLIDNNVNNKLNYYKKLREIIIKIGDQETNGVEEFFYKLFTFKEIVEEKEFDINLREEICEECIQLMEGYMQSYYSSYKQNCIDYQFLKIYVKILNDYLEILEEKYNIDKENIYSWLNNLKNEKDLKKEEITANKVKELITHVFAKDEINYIDILIQVFIFTPDKSKDEEIKNKIVSFFAPFIEGLTKLIGGLLALKTISKAGALPSLLFGSVIAYKFSDDFLNFLNEKKFLWGDENERRQMILNKKNSYENIRTSYLYKGLKLLKKVISTPFSYISYYSGNLLGSDLRKNDKFGFGKNSENDIPIDNSFNIYYKNVVYSLYINKLNKWDHNFNDYAEMLIKNIKNDYYINKDLNDFYDNKKKFLEIIINDKRKELEKKMEKKWFWKIYEPVKGFFWGIGVTFPKIIKGLFNKSDYDGNKKIDFEKEIGILKNKKEIEKAQEQINEINKENYYKLKDIYLNELKNLLQLFPNGAEIFSKMCLTFQEELERIKKIYEDVWGEEEKFIFEQNFFNLKEGLKIILKENEELNDWIYVETKTVYVKNEKDEKKDKESGKTNEKQDLLFESQLKLKNEKNNNDDEFEII